MEYMRKLIVLVVAVVSSLSLAAQDFKIDPVHSSANFAVKHMLVSTVRGRFAGAVNGTIHYDPADISKSSVTAVIATASIDTDNQMRDKDLRSANFFDVEKYPEIRFESTKVEKRGDGYVAIGNLTIKDVTRQIELPFTLTEAEIRGRKKLGIESSTTINRFDYHVNFDPTGTTVGKDVKIELDLEANLVDAAAPTK
jgi:polyisoprenoid-binding protein YceI